VGASGAEKVGASACCIQFPCVEHRACKGSAATPGREVTVTAPVGGPREWTATPQLMAHGLDCLICEKRQACGCRPIPSVTRSLI